MKNLEQVECFEGNITYKNAFKLFEDVNKWGYLAYLPKNSDIGQPKLTASSTLLMVNQSNKVVGFINISDEDNQNILNFMNWYYEGVPNPSDELPF